MFENEEWRIIEDLPHYSISNYGRVKHQNTIEARKVSISDKGFPVVTLYGADSKTRYLRQVNKLVADAFVPGYNTIDESTGDLRNAVWHIDGDLTNCSADNLLWETRSRVLEWNDMHRLHIPRYSTPKVRNNRTGVIYENAFHCAMAEGELESKIVWRIEKQARSFQDDSARYRYV